MRCGWHSVFRAFITARADKARGVAGALSASVCVAEIRFRAGGTYAKYVVERDKVAWTFHAIAVVCVRHSVFRAVITSRAGKTGLVSGAVSACGANTVFGAGGTDAKITESHLLPLA